MVPHVTYYRQNRKTINELKFLMTYPSFSNYFSRTSLAIALKVYLLVKEKNFVVLFIENVEISPCGFVCKGEESSVMLANFRLSIP